IAQFPRLINALVLISGVVNTGYLKDSCHQGVTADGEQNQVNEEIGNRAVEHHWVPLVRSSEEQKRRASLTHSQIDRQQQDGHSLVGAYAQWKASDISFLGCYKRPPARVRRPLGDDFYIRFRLPHREWTKV